jgi:hypothetical protein
MGITREIGHRFRHLPACNSGGLSGLPERSGISAPAATAVQSRNCSGFGSIDDPLYSAMGGSQSYTPRECNARLPCQLGVQWPCSRAVCRCAAPHSSTVACTSCISGPSLAVSRRIVVRRGWDISTKLGQWGIREGRVQHPLRNAHRSADDVFLEGERLEHHSHLPYEAPVP